ncbi:MAG: radical SAM protein [Bdellovibrionales bacterium]|nr:radical SAM protein [Bdellovibrionales bacterium]
MSETQGERSERLRVAFQTYGCRSNYADTIDLQAALVERGAVPCELDAAADVYVVNTCTVTNSADREALKLIRKIKSQQPGARIVVTGCMAESDGAGLADLVGEAGVVGPGRRSEVLAAILGEPAVSEPQVRPVAEVHPSGRRARKALPERRSISLLNVLSPEIAGPGSTIGEVATRARYHLRVQEGCENACTFCIIPHTRGRLSSRPIAAVVSDVRALYERGYREIVLTGTHLGGYGEDIGSSLVELLQELRDDAVPLRIRLSSIDPNDVSEELLDVMASDERFCRHLHICVQAFTDRTLKRMNRRYHLEQAIDILSLTAERLPDVCIGSDLICGFPGETREEVEQGIETFLQLPIAYLHVFPYSERSNTAATRLDGPVPLPERRRRAARWRALQRRQREAYYTSLAGRSLAVIVERHDEEFLYGTSSEFASVKVARQGARRTAALGSLVEATAVRCDPQDGLLEAR